MASRSRRSAAGNGQSTRSVIVELPESVLVEIAAWAAAHGTSVHALLAQAALGVHAACTGSSPADDVAGAVERSAA